MRQSKKEAITLQHQAEITSHRREEMTLAFAFEGVQTGEQEAVLCLSGAGKSPWLKPGT